MGRAAGIGVPLAVVVEVDLSANSGDRPRGGVTDMNFANNHLLYALTWYALAIALVVIFVLYHRIGREAQP